MIFLQSFELDICYGSIRIYSVDDPDVGTLAFEQQHLSQGFAWSPAEVDFYVDFNKNQLEACGGLFEVYLANQIEVASDSTRAVLVPFTVGERGINVSDVVGSYVDIPIPKGHYALLFELKPRDDIEYLNSEQYQCNIEAGFIELFCRLTFVLQESVVSEVLRSDEYLSPSYPLLMEAKPI
jgi:hypothetical protein